MILKSNSQVFEGGNRLCHERDKVRQFLRHQQRLKEINQSKLPDGDVLLQRSHSYQNF